MWGLLKPNFKPHKYWSSEVRCCNSTYRLRYWNLIMFFTHFLFIFQVATAPTVYGIETTEYFDTACSSFYCCNSTYRLRYWNGLRPEIYYEEYSSSLQQHLPFTVLKPYFLQAQCNLVRLCCNSTYRLRYWNKPDNSLWRVIRRLSCNSTYRLRYWNHKTTDRNHLQFVELQQHLPFTVLKPRSLVVTTLLKPDFKVATAPTVYGIETHKSWK